MNKEKLSDIISQIKKDEFLLPDFQREFVWSFKQQKDLIASVISSVPASSSLLVEEKNFMTPKFKCIIIGRRYSNKKNHNAPFYYILDGQQRFTTLFYAFTNVFNDNQVENEKTFDDIDYKLKVRWFLKLATKSGYLFNFDTLIFSREEAEKYLPSDLVDYIEEEKIKKDSIRKDKKEYIKFLKKESLENTKIPIQLFLSNIDDSYLIKSWLEIIQKKRIQDLRENRENSKCLARLFKFFQKKDPEKLADRFYNDDKEAKNIFEECIKDDVVRNWYDKVYNYLKSKISSYEIKPIVLDDMFKAISTFEYINTRGTDLSTFDLLCAKAGTRFDLRKSVIEKCVKPFDFYDYEFNFIQNYNLENNFNLIDSNGSVQKQYAEYLAQVFNLIHYRKNGGTPTDPDFSTKLQKASYSLDNLDSKFLKNNFEKAVQVINLTSAILQVFCGHADHKKITNKLILLPIFTFFVYTDHKLRKDEIRKIIAFFWIKLFSGKYNAHQSEFARKHAIQIYKWLIKNDNSIAIELKDQLDFNVLKVEDFANKELLTTQKCNKSVEENIFMFLRSSSKNFYDWDDMSSKIEVTDDVQIHHIIPLFSGITKMKELTKALRDNPKNQLNATMNRTPISKKTNSKIGAKSPHQYQQDVKPTQLAYHFITEDWFQPNRDLKNLFETRFNTLIARIQTKLGDYLD